MNSHILAAAAVLGLAGTALGVSTISASQGSAASTGDRVTATTEPLELTFRLASRGSEDKYIDVGREGDSTGDSYLAAVTLRADGHVAGRLQNECTVLDNTYEGHLCTMAIVLADGQLTLATGGVNKPIPDVDGRHGDVYAVTGGTGTYLDAAGELRVSDDGSKIIVTLVD